MTEKFRPNLSASLPKGPKSFQVVHLRISGELGERASAVVEKFGLRNAKFVEACVEFALNNMEQDNE